MALRMDFTSIDIFFKSLLCTKNLQNYLFAFEILRIVQFTSGKFSSKRCLKFYDLSWLHSRLLLPCFIFRQQMFEFDNSMKDDDKDSFHFVAYMHINGRLYELDGLKDGPVDLGMQSDLLF